MAILGDNSAGSDYFNCNSDRSLMQLVTATEAGDINSGHAYFDAITTAGTSGKVILYTDGGTAPDAQVAVSSAVAIPAGGGLVNFTMSGSFSAGDLYLGIVTDNFQAKLQSDPSLSGQDMQMANGTFSYSSPPATYPGTTSSYTDIRINVYLDYTASGGGGGGQPTISRLGGVPSMRAGPRNPGRSWKQRIGGIFQPDDDPRQYRTPRSFVSFLLPKRFA